MAQQIAVMVPLLGLSIAGVVLLLHVRRKRQKRVDFGAFIARFVLSPAPPLPPPAAPHPLTGLTFAVKDIFDVEGMVTGFGSAAWAETHEASPSTAPAISDLLAAGATCLGKTCMDELAFSIWGGSPPSVMPPENPAAPQCFPGGSSSGSAVAVAGNIVDFALGTDTAGSIRVPAAFCGVMGFRPSHGATSPSGIVPMAPSLDTLGVIARDARVLHQVGHVLLHQPYSTPRVPIRIVIADDLFDMVSSALPRRLLVEPVINATEKHIGPIVKYVRISQFIASSVPSLTSFSSGPPSSNGSSSNGTDSAPVGQALAPVVEALKALQRYEFREAHEEWFSSAHPRVESGDIARRVQMALSLGSVHEASLASRVRDELRNAFSDLLKNDGLLVMPTVPFLAPSLKTKTAVLDEMRDKAMLLLSLSSLSGCPQVSIPCGEMDGSSGAPPVPLSVSFVARHGADRFLLDAITLFAPAVAEEAKVVAEKAKRSAGSANAKSTSGDARPVQSPAESAKEKGNAAYKERKFTDAVEFYSQAIKLDPLSATYYNNRAMAYLQLCNFQQVEADCSQALKLDKKNVKAMLRRGTAREFLGCYAEALEDFRQALVLEPTNRTALEAVDRLSSSGLI